MATPDDVQKLIEMARAAGLRRLKVEGVEFEFSDSPAAPNAKQSLRGRPVPTPEGFLFWSTGESIPYSDGTLDGVLAPDAAKAPDLKAS